MFNSTNPLVCPSAQFYYDTMLRYRLRIDAVPCNDQETTDYTIYETTFHPKEEQNRGVICEFRMSEY